MRQTVADLRQRGVLSDSGATRVLAAATEVEAKLGSETTPTTQIASTIPGLRDTRGTTGTTRKVDQDDDEDDD